MTLYAICALIGGTKIISGSMSMKWDESRADIIVDVTLGFVEESWCSFYCLKCAVSDRPKLSSILLNLLWLLCVIQWASSLRYSLQWYDRFEYFYWNITTLVMVRNRCEWWGNIRIFIQHGIFIPNNTHIFFINWLPQRRRRQQPRPDYQHVQFRWAVWAGEKFGIVWRRVGLDVMVDAHHRGLLAAPINYAIIANTIHSGNESVGLCMLVDPRRFAKK